MTCSTCVMCRDISLHLSERGLRPHAHTVRRSFDDNAASAATKNSIPPSATELMTPKAFGKSPLAWRGEATRPMDHP